MALRPEAPAARALGVAGLARSARCVSPIAPSGSTRSRRSATEVGKAEGAALFAALAPAGSAGRLVRTSVAYQVMNDYLDTITEPLVRNQAANCEQLHRGAVEALDPHARTSDWYDLHPSCDDGGYLAAQLAVCRSVCRSLPSYGHVAPQLRRSARRSGEVQTLNHAAPARRAESLREWAARLSIDDPSLSWWEHAAGASSTLDVHTLLALAADPSTAKHHVAAALPHLTALCALNTLLESLVDLPADRRTGDFSYISQYASPRHAAERVAYLAERAVRLAATMPRPSRHIAIEKAMASLYLSRREAWTWEAEPIARAALAALPGRTRTLVVLQRLRKHVRWA